MPTSRPLLFPFAVFGTLVSLAPLRAATAASWDPSDSPSLFSPSFEYSLAALPTSGEVANIAWASSYWPIYQDTINHRWAGPGSLSPAEKYGIAFGQVGVEDAVSLESGIDAHPGQPACDDDLDCNLAAGEACGKRRAASSGVCIPTWWGITDGSAAASLLLPEPTQSVTHNGVTFAPADLKALLSLVHHSAGKLTAGTACQGPVVTDLSGRPVPERSDCVDSNPGSMHVILANTVGVEASAFVEDRTFDDEVWNQPVIAFVTPNQKHLTAAKARRLLGKLDRERSRFEVAEGQFLQLGELPAAAGETLQIRVRAGGDVDLHVRFDSEPTLSSFDCAPKLPAGDESCTVVAPPGATRVFVAVDGAVQTAGRLTMRFSPEAGYPYNPAAAQFVRVRANVSSIRPVPVSIDGSFPPATVSTAYQYILELDANGVVIGGEWLGDSKANHPDFLWKPLPLQQATVAGGKIAVADVLLLHSLSD